MEVLINRLDITLRVIPPIATESGITAQVEVQSPVSGEFERIQEISLVDIGDILVNEEAIKGVLVELGGTTGTPIFSTVVYFDGAVAAAPVELVTKVPAGTEVTVRTQLVVESEEKVFPEVYESSSGRASKCSDDASGNSAIRLR